ncbi:MAG: matrixin family metalloprotease [Hyphomicrobium sp.]|uniref:matrixin family metalloprotease n=1 Tax=Hyphomicrobium sp. TaxID=82 RepID=UPI003D0BC586
MRGSVLAGCFALTLASVTYGARAGDDARNASEFRLLELGGRHVRWQLPHDGLPAKITYAFLTGPAEFSGARNCDAMLPPEAALEPSHVDAAAFRREVRAAFTVWEAAANIMFVETSSVADAGILIGADAKARGRAFTNVALADERAHARGIGAIRQSLICLNPKRPWKIGFDGNLDVYDVRFTMTHEIGHAIGLDHPSPEGQLMSFRYVERIEGLQAGDIAGAVALYGRKGAGSTAAREAARSHGSSGVPRAAEEPAFGLGEPETPSRRR